MIFGHSVSVGNLSLYKLDGHKYLWSWTGRKNMEVRFRDLFIFFSILLSLLSNVRGKVGIKDEKRWGRGYRKDKLRVICFYL